MICSSHVNSGHRWLHMIIQCENSSFGSRWKVKNLKVTFAVAGYFGRNLRSIAVLIDRDVDEKGRAGFEPRRITTWGMNCVRMISSISVQTIWPVHDAIFYIPISSTKSQLLEAKQNLLRMNQTMTLTDWGRGGYWWRGCALRKFVGSFDSDSNARFE